MELQCILIEEKETEEYKKTNKFSPLKMKGGFLHECTELMPNEEFYDFKEFPEIKASKNGRIMHKGKIIPQEPENNENRYDYLWVNVPGYKYIKVYELVAKTFLLSNNPDPAKYRIIIISIIMDLTIGL